MHGEIVYFDGLAGPTHNFGGLSFGNLSSMASKMTPASPKRAALQGLYKMKMLADMGIKQGILPPQERPDIATLRRVGFTGADHQVIEKAHKHAPELLVACCSSSSVYAANAASITPSADTADGRVHITPANLISQFHRSLEPTTTQMALYALFPDPDAFYHHEPLPAHLAFGDEGSANRLHFYHTPATPGVHLFCYGKQGANHRFPARQSRAACEAIARQHGINASQVVYAQTSTEAIEQGIFHNDLISLAYRNLLIYHEQAWENCTEVVDELQKKMEQTGNGSLHVIKISNKELSLNDLIESYLLNSQVITIDNDRAALVAPVECKEHARVEPYLRQLVAGDNPIDKVYYFDLKEAMKNGGGPRCLTLPLPLTKSEVQSVLPTVLMNDILYSQLVEWVNTHYRDELKPGDLADPHLLFECRTALDELTDILDLGPLYPFQQECMI